MDIGFGTPYAAMQRSKAPIRIIYQLSKLVFFPAFTNTELGLLFEHPTLVADITGMIDALSAPDQAYTVSRPNHALQWTVARPGLPKLMYVEPEASKPQRAISWLVGLLPIQAYL